MASNNEELLRKMSRLRTPLGRIGEKLGFRWVFWWTLPIPFHPLFAALILLSPLLGIGWSLFSLVSGSEAPVGWVSLIVIGLLLGIPLSVPVIRAVAMLFRLHWVQAGCFAGAMLQLGTEVALGQTHLLLGLLPLAFFGLHLGKVIHSRVEIVRWRRINDRFRPVELRHGPVLLSGTQLWTETMELLSSGLTSVVMCDTRHNTGSVGLAGRAAVALPQYAVPAFKELFDEGLVPQEWQLLDKNQLQLPGWPELPVATIAWDSQNAGGASLTKLTVIANGVSQCLVVGKAAPTFLLPFFVIIYAVPFPQGTSHWLIGFVPGKLKALGPPRAPGQQGVSTLAFAPPEQLAAPVDPVPILKRLTKERDRVRAATLRELGALLTRRNFAVSGEAWRRLIACPSLLSDQGEPLLAMLERAKRDRDELGAWRAAFILSLLPIDEFRAMPEPIATALSSRILALRWELTAELDRSTLPRECPRFGRYAGFGLMEKVPVLWERLGELGPLAAKVTALFIKEVGEQPMLVKARERLIERGVPFPTV